MEKIKVVIGQLGSPKDTSVPAVRSYLKEFLGDRRVVDINPLLWKIILNCFVLPFRPKRSAEAYSRIWEGDGFPLVTGTVEFCRQLEKHLDPRIELNHCFLLSDPRLSKILNDWEHEDHYERAQEVYVLPQFPQYSESTIASVLDTVGAEFSDRVNIPSLNFVSCYHRLKAFIDLGAKKIYEHADQFDELVISFHGIPLRRFLEKKDIYYLHCYETYMLIQKKLSEMGWSGKMHFCFQSRFGSEQWLGPATDEYCIDLIENHGVKKIGVYCPSFVVDCLETTDEIGNELVEEVEEVGGHITFIPCLNQDEDWVQQYAAYINDLVFGDREQLEKHFYQVDAKEVKMNIPEQKYQSPPLSKNAKSTLKIVFLTLFLDLIGFSIIFPMFPALAKHYLAVDGDNTFLKLIFGSISSLTSVTSQATGINPIVLFGGALGGIYSLLQFIAAPIWGGISDRIGRKPVLIISVFGLAASYVMWFFAGGFTMLIAARFIGGIMGGNLSTASAVVADVTDAKNRSKGMAFIGIAFALGFIFGPALGGLLSMIDLTQIYPSLVSYGVNPFSVPAALAALLSFINFFYLIKKFKETLPEEKRGQREQHRFSNPLKLFKPLPYKLVNRTNYIYFLFITAFSGMEFTLTFLAVERLSYSPLDNGYMFIFIGLIIALVQGGYVRRKASQVGEVKMARNGLVALVPGLLIIAFANSGFLLYAGLFFLAVGSAMVIPCLTALVSLYSPSQVQGRSLGVFRSLGSFARVIGPVLASLVYWRYGSVVPYVAGAIALIIPILMMGGLKQPENAS